MEQLLSEFGLTETSRVSSLLLTAYFFGGLLACLSLFFLNQYIRQAYPREHKGFFMGIASSLLLDMAIVRIMTLGTASLLYALKGSLEENLYTAISHTIYVSFYLIVSCVMVWGLYLLYKFLQYHQGESCIGNAANFGLGYVTILLVYQCGIVYFLNCLMGFSTNANGLTKVLSTMAEEEREDFLSGISFLYSVPFYEAFLFVLQAIAYGLLLIGIMTVIHEVLVGKLKKKTMWVAVCAYFGYCLGTLLIDWGVTSHKSIAYLVSMLPIAGFLYWLAKTLPKHDPDAVKAITYPAKHNFFMVSFGGRVKNEEKKISSGIGKSARAVVKKEETKETEERQETEETVETTESKET